MERAKRQRLHRAGWRTGDAADFLDLTPEEAALVEIKAALSQDLRRRRQEHMTQVELAQRIGSSQPRVARAECGDRSVSMELIIRALLATGATQRDIAAAIAAAPVASSSRR
jgi:DNA-binding XRE family transcriptional regulator